MERQGTWPKIAPNHDEMELVGANHQPTYHYRLFGAKARAKEKVATTKEEAREFKTIVSTVGRLGARQLSAEGTAKMATEDLVEVMAKDASTTYKAQALGGQHGTATVVHGAQMQQAMRQDIRPGYPHETSIA